MEDLRACLEEAEEALLMRFLEGVATVGLVGIGDSEELGRVGREGRYLQGTLLKCDLIRCSYTLQPRVKDRKMLMQEECELGYSAAVW